MNYVHINMNAYRKKEFISASQETLQLFNQQTTVCTLTRYTQENSSETLVSRTS
jgi:hypothetical protein